MRRQQKLCLAAVLLSALLFAATNSFATNGRGNTLNTVCAPNDAKPYTDTEDNCTLCHVSNSNTSTMTDAMRAYNAGGDTRLNYFCPAPQPPPCTDSDGDSYATDGGTCGPVDCNDRVAAINPGAVDIPNNGIDEDCSGSDRVDVSILDTDGDGYTPATGDCDDNDPAINPRAVENCTDNRDNDCDGFVDDMDLDAVGCPEPVPACTDGDNDTFAFEGGVCGPIDCNDRDPAINPDAVDILNNGIDENCSGADSVDISILDGDGDGFSIAAGDCNDSDLAINPAAVDIPNNGIDEDCSGRDRVDTSLLDNDRDGFTPAAGDCDDSDGAVNPDAVEICTDGMDNDCDGMVDTQDPDAVDCPIACTDNDNDNYAVEGGGCGPIDCDEGNADINPGAVELCDDLIDNDCDELIDEGCDLTCPDNDGDGYPDASCGGTDCDDTDTAVNPAAAEVCGNSIDENCNGASDDVCTTCPDGALLKISEAAYNYERRSLKISGRANSETTVTLLDTDAGSILATNLEVRRGKFSKKVRSLGPDEVPVMVAAINEEGCASAELQVRMENMPVEDEDDRDDGDREREQERDDDDEDDHDRDRDRDDD